MNPYNLIDEPWIPVRYRDQRNTRVSLTTLFQESKIITDLDCPPHERISLMRLLVCITQAELGAPNTSDDWDDFGKDMETRVISYLQRPDIYPHFELFGDGVRFLQGAVDETDRTYLISQMVFDMADGNAPTLLDHNGGTERVFHPDFIARALLSYQNFFVGGSMASKVKGNGPCLKMLHSLLSGTSIKDSIILNCIDQSLIDDHFKSSGKGVPIWECQPANINDNIDSYLGRLVPSTCLIRLCQDRLHVWIENGFSCSEFPETRDTFSTIYVKKDERRALRADLMRGIWADLHIVTVLRHSKKNELCAPLVLQSHLSDRQEQALWLSELYKAKDAKIIDIVKSFFTVPAAMYGDEGRRRYELGVAYADAQSNQLYGAVKQYGSVLKRESPPIDFAKRHYWSALEQQSYLLLNIVRQPELLDGKSFGEGNDPWTVAVWEAAKAAYKITCSHQTPRELQAYVTGQRFLRVKSGNQKSTRTKNANA